MECYLQMKNFFKRPYRWAAIFSIVLIVSFSFTLLDTFVISKSFAVATPNTATRVQDSIQTGSQAFISDTSYEDKNIKISIETVEKYDSTFYIADIQLTDASYLKTALADNTYGQNIKETTSDMADAQDAIFAVNGDYYGFRSSGVVIRNGVLYRETLRDGTDNEDLVIDQDGNFSIITESQDELAALNTDEIQQILSFGPGLVENGKITVSSSSEVSQSKNSNPRTAIGQISELHYVVLVADGRTNKSEGLSLLELAQIFKDRNCTTAYNLDGGGSSTMYLNGKIVNIPTDGRTFGEREVSDIVYVGY